ncbi:Uncharacterised protein [Mycobacterium tuberculosis]|nr:Uncharacterised protein [Mycobacterium tuberculosis]
MPDHADLTHGERDEHTDDVQLDQRGQLGTKRDHRPDRRRRQEQDSVGERQPVPTGVQLARQIAVLRQHRAQHREAVEGGVSGQHQDQRCHRGDQQEPQVKAPEHGLRQLCDQRLLLITRRGARQLGVRIVDDLDPGLYGQHDHAHKHAHRNDAQHQQRGCRVTRLGLLKRRHPVADRLDTRQRRTPRRKRARHQEHQRETDDLAVLCVHFKSRGLGPNRIAQHENPEQPPHEHGADSGDERIGRDRERQPGFPNPTQVHRHDQHDRADGKQHLVLVHERAHRADVGRRRRYRNSNGENVIHHQGAGNHETAGSTQVGGDNLVVAPTGGVSVHVLPVTRHHHEQNRGDRQADQRRHRIGRQAGHREHQKYLLGGVGYRRHRIRGEHRQGDPLGQQGVTEPVTAKRPADQQPTRRG